MNITHAVSEEIDCDGLIAIFNRQKELMEKYHDIEKRSGLLQTEDCPVNLDDKRGQARIKDFSWRIMEEVGEALDAYEDEAHFKEELIDGLHFLTELTILSGSGPDDVVWDVPMDNSLIHTLYEQSRTTKEVFCLIPDLVMDLGMMCNCLKNKPWKQTNMVTDKNEFYHKLRCVWADYFAILSTCFRENEIVDVYLKKSQVNKFRQRSNY